MFSFLYSQQKKMRQNAENWLEVADRVRHFRRDLLTGQTTLCSRSHTGVGGANLPSWPPSLSADGSTVAFLSDATNLLPLDGNEATDLFAWVAGPLPTALSAAQGGGTALITWLESGNNCVLLSATNPSAPAASWAPVTSGITDFGLVKVYAAHFAPGEPTRYYRLRCP